VRGLFALRALLGRLCGWDADMYMHQETSSLHRLSSDITRRSALPPGTLDGPFRVLYVLEERVAGRGAERDGARLPGVRAHRNALRISPVLGGLCATRVPAHPALHGADRAVPPVHRLSGDLSPDPESLGGALHTPSRSTCIGYCLTPHRTVSKPHLLRVLVLQTLDFVKPLLEQLTFDTVWHWSPDKIISLREAIDDPQRAVSS
jgi:hypothetical protein